MKEKINFKRLGTTIGLVLLTTLVVGGTTWYLMDEQSKSDQKVLLAQLDALREENSTSKNAEKTTYPEYDTVKDWQTYANKQYKFSFKHPEELVVTECAEKIGIEETPLVVMLSKTKLTCNALAGDIRIELIKGGGAPEPDESNITSKIATFIDGSKATRYLLKNEGPNYASQVTGIMHNGHAINFSLVESSNVNYNRELENTFSNLLGTVELN